MVATAGSSSRRHWLICLGAAWLVALPAFAQSPPRASTWCEESGGLALIGFDTAAGRLLLASSNQAGFLLEIEVERRLARRVAIKNDGGFFAGSAATGPIVALRRCGEACIEAHQWIGDHFEPLGTRLDLPSTANLFTTRDRSGAPWLVTHRPGPGRWLEAAAYRLEGESWKPQGRLSVQAALASAVLPAPGHPNAVISGTGLFAAGRAPKTWVQGFPALPPDKEGEVAPLGPAGAAYFSSDGAVYSSPDAGASWQGSRFRPWGREPSEIWTYGTDYSVDLPLGTLGVPLPLAWFDRRGGRSGRIFLTELAATGGWKVTGELPADLDVGGTEPVEWVHLLHRDGGTWLLLSDCFNYQGQATLALLVSTLAGPEAPVFLTVP